jgi:hypothetical protein
MYKNNRRTHLNSEAHSAKNAAGTAIVALNNAMDSLDELDEAIRTVSADMLDMHDGKLTADLDYCRTACELGQYVSDEITRILQKYFS